MYYGDDLTFSESLSARRAWIEIVDAPNLERIKYGSLSARRAWIEMLFYKLYDIMPWSLSARRAWIEMRMALFPAPPTMVALRKESVDRNTTLTVFYAFSKSLSALAESDFEKA